MNRRDDLRTKLFELVRFCMVGGLAAGIHYGVYLLLQQWINLTVAYALGYGFALIVNFFLTSYFTFKSRPTTTKAAGFGISHLINFLLHMGLFPLFIRMGVSRFWAPVLVLAIAVPTNFVLLRWVFKHNNKLHS